MDLLFHTLHYPAHTRIRYEYSNDECILYDELRGLADKRTRAIMSFLDMDPSCMNRYLPLRLGLLEKVEYSDGRLYVYVTLEDYCHTKDEESYASYISRVLPNVYHAEGKGTKWTGLLVAESNEEPPEGLLTSAQESWINTARQVSKRRVFSDCFPVFTKMNISTDKGESLSVDYSSATRSAYHMRSNRVYRLSIAHYAPLLKDNENTEAHFTVQDSNGVFVISPQDYTVGNPQSEHVFILRTNRFDDTKMAAIKITPQEHVVEDKEIKYVHESIDIDVESYITPRTRYLIIAALVFLMGAAMWLQSLPVAEILTNLEAGFASNSLTTFERVLYALCKRLDGLEYIYEAVCSGVVALSTLGMIHFYGKPKL